MTEFKYAPMFQLGKDETEYRLISKEGITVAKFEGKEIVKVAPEALTLLAQEAFHDCEFLLRREHNEQVAAIMLRFSSSAMPKRLQRVSCLSVRTLVQRLSTVKKVSRYGLVSRTKKHFRLVFSTRSHKKTYAIRKMLRLQCSTK